MPAPTPISTSGTEGEYTDSWAAYMANFFPYIKPYKKRLCWEIFSNAMARFRTLFPFVFIGFAVDY
ncbi:MAG: hypothetical protein Ct9H90mP16_16010 [Candidatus Poseidoniales archaeon]|nr:MAG: hypothetical protein Ct9H90mP16_16010 [Candidatus Poseidoniales archaeon]